MMLCHVLHATQNLILILFNISFLDVEIKVAEYKSKLYFILNFHSQKNHFTPFMVQHNGQSMSEICLASQQNVFPITNIDFG